MIEVLKGMKDRVKEEAKMMEYLYEKSSNIFKRYGYERVITPLLESYGLFKRSVGDDTDIVSKEMYELKDKGGRHLALRPEGTAGVVRCYLEQGFHKSNPNVKWYYQGSMYRYEAPQKGRYREFNQIGIEAFGVKEPLLDAEIIKMACDFLEEIGINNTIVEINNIGDKEERENYVQDLKEYLSNHLEVLSHESKKRFEKNPLRILDSKELNDIEVIKNAPKLYDYLNSENKKYFDDVLKYLSILGVEYKINHNLVRGLDYYSSTVFEIKSQELGSQSTIIGGGRYDRLLYILGKANIPAIGFAMGVERLMLLLDKEKFNLYLENNKKYYAIYFDETKEYMLNNIIELRNKGYQVEYDYSVKGFSNQMKKADKLGFKKVIIFGEDEMKENKITVKNFVDSIQETVTLEEFIERR